MKKPVGSLALIFCTGLLLNAEPTPKILPTTIKKATVFIQGAQITRTGKSKEKPNAEIYLTVETKTPLSAARFTLTYIVWNAGWFPTYDIRVNSLDEPVALVTDWESYNLSEGEANLFFENTFVGKSVLDVKYLSDTLNISLGRDNSITVSREKQKDFSTHLFNISQ